MFTLCYVKCWVKLMYTFYKVLSKTHVHTLQCKVWTWVLLSLCKVWTWLFIPQFPYYSSFQQCDFLLASQKVINHLLYPIVLAQQSCFSILLFCWIICCKLVQTINKPGFHFINIWKPGYKIDMKNVSAKFI